MDPSCSCARSFFHVYQSFPTFSCLDLAEIKLQQNAFARKRSASYEEASRSERRSSCGGRKLHAAALEFSASFSFLSVRYFFFHPQLSMIGPRLSRHVKSCSLYVERSLQCSEWVRRRSPPF